MLERTFDRITKRGRLSESDEVRRQFPDEQMSDRME